MPARLSLIALAALAPVPAAAETTFDSNGVKIHYIDRGRGEAVVLLHGFTASAREMWLKSPLLPNPLLPVLAKDFRAIALDFRGHGRSDKPHDPKAYGGQMAADVVRLLDHLKVKKAHVIGYSMGAMVAGKLLVTHPDRLLSVTFGGAGPLYRIPKGLEDVTRATVESLERGDGIGPLIRELAPTGRPQPSEKQAAAVGKLVVRGKDQKALAAVMRGFDGLRVTEAQLRANKVPVRFIHGSRERNLKQLIDGSAELLKGAKVTVIDGKDHMTTLLAPRFQREVLEFLKGRKK